MQVERIDPEQNQQTPSLRCWICFEERESSPEQTWRKPCPCSLEAHESCILSWIHHSGKDFCPQCGAKFIVETPRPNLLMTLFWLADSYTLLMSSVVAFSIVGTQAGQWLSQYGHVAAFITGATPYDPRYFTAVTVSTVPPFFFGSTDIGTALIPICLIRSRFSSGNMYWPIIAPLLFEADDWRLSSSSTATAFFPLIRQAYYFFWNKTLGKYEDKWARELGQSYSHQVILQPMLEPRIELGRFRWLFFEVGIRHENENENVVNQPLQEFEEADQEPRNENQQDANRQREQEIIDRQGLDAIHSFQLLILNVLKGVRGVIEALLFPLASSMCGYSLSSIRCFRRLPFSRFHWSIIGGCSIILTKDLVKFLYLYTQFCHKNGRRIRDSR